MASSEVSRSSRFFRVLINAIGGLAALVLVLAALYVGLGRVLIGQVDVYREDLERLLSERLGQDVDIGALAGSWVALDPVILLEDMTVGDPGVPDAALQVLRIRVSTLASLFRGRLVFREFSASHADITLTQDSQGGLGLSGLWQPGSDKANGFELLEAAAQDFDNSFSDWIEELGEILADPVVRVSDLRLSVQTPGQAVQHYQIPAIDLAFKEGVFSADGRLAQVETNETVAWFTLKGQHFFRGGFDGTLYLDIRSERIFDTLLQPYEWFDVGLEGLDLHTSAWLSFEKGQISRVQAQVGTPYLQLRPPSASLPPIENLEVVLTARRLVSPCVAAGACDDRSPEWELQAKGLQYDWLGRQIGPANIHWQGTATDWTLSADVLDLAGLAELVEGLEILPARAAQALRTYRPKGEATGLLMEYTGGGDFLLQAGLRQVSVEAFDGAPVIQGLDGWLEHDATGGRVIYDSAEAVFGFPDLFAAAWQFKRMTGEVGWRLANGDWTVAGEDLRFRYGADTTLSGAFELLLPDEGPPTLGVRVGLADANQNHLSRFVPVGIVGSGLYDWLTGAVVAGRIPWGWYYGRGVIGDDPTIGAAADAAQRIEVAENVEGVEGLEDSEAAGSVDSVENVKSTAGAGAAEPTESPGASGNTHTAEAVNTPTDTRESGETTVPTAGFRSAMVYDFYDLDLDFADDWPALENARGQFRYQDGEGWVDIDAATIGGLAVQPSQAWIDTRSDATQIDISTGSTVTGKDLSFWLDNTALAAMAGGSAEPFGFSGTADMSLGLTIFTAEDAASVPATQVNASVALKDVTISHTSSGYAWRALNGIVDFSSVTGLSSTNLSARFLDHEARIQLSGGGERPVELHQWGQAGIAELNGQLEQPLPFVEGRFNYDLRFSAGERPVLGFQVELAGVAVNLPAPFSKPADEPGLLQGNLVPEGEGGIRIQGTWSNRFAYQMLWHEGKLQQAALALSSETAPLGPSPYFIGGTLPKLDVNAWASVLKPMLTGTQEAPDLTIEHTFDLPLQADLKIGELRIGPAAFQDVGVTAAPLGPDWEIGLTGPSLAGNLILRAEGPHSIELDRLVLTEALTETLTESPAEDVAEQAQSSAEDQSVHYPSADVRIEELWLGDSNYGRWVFQTRAVPGALNVNGIEARTGSLKFAGDLTWHFSPDASERTRLMGTLEGGNISDLSAWLDAGVPLDSETTRARMNLAWPGAPQDFSLATLAGEMALGLEDGTILDQNDAAQIFRVFGILNADTLMRRLRLDFSDLYQAGVSFEALSGSAVVSNGILTLDPELQLTGPSGAFRLIGSTHLLEETLDMSLVVVLPLTQNLPVAALLFGAAAPVGGALFILDKLLGDPLSKLTSATYDVSGVWSKPEVSLRNIFDTGADLRNYERPELDQALDPEPEHPDQGPVPKLDPARAAEPPSAEVPDPQALPELPAGSTNGDR